MNKMKALYFKYPKYIFLLFLAYTLYILSDLPDSEIGYTEIIMGVICPYLPVWLSSHLAKKFDNDLVGSPLNILSLSVPAIVMALEVYIIFTRSLVSDGNGSGLIGAFAFGTFTFFVLFGINLMLTVFVKTHIKPIKQD